MSEEAPSLPRTTHPRLPRLWWGSRRWMLCSLVALGVAHAAVVLGMALLLRDVLESQSTGPFPVALCGGLLGLGALAYGLRTLDAMVAEALGQNYISALRLKLVRKLQQSSWDPGANARLGLTMSRLVNDLSSVRTWVSRGIARFASSIASIAGLSIGLAFLNPILAGTSLAMLLVGFVVAACLVRPVLHAVQHARQHRGRLAGFLGELVDHPITSRRFGRVPAETKELRRRGAALRRAQIRLAAYQSLLRSSPELAHGAGVALLAAIVVGMGSSDHLSASQFGPSLVLIAILTSAMRDLASAWCQRLSFMEGRRRIQQLLSRPTLPTSSTPLSIPRGVVPLLRLVDLRARGLPSSITATIHPGECIVLQGPSGSGKSTLARLIARLRDPEQGQIIVGDLDLRNLTESSAAHVIQLVSQDLPLRRGTVRENLQFGAQNPAKPDLEAAANLCQLKKKHGIFPDGLATEVAERGANLTSGQRARLSLARAIAPRPGILIVDDTTLVTDPGHARILRNAIEWLGASCIVVAENNPFPGMQVRFWELKRADVEPAQGGTLLPGSDPSLAQPHGEVTPSSPV